MTLTLWEESGYFRDLRFHAVHIVTKEGERFSQHAKLGEHFFPQHIGPAGFVLSGKGWFLGWFLRGFHENDLTNRRARLSNFTR